MRFTAELAMVVSVLVSGVISALGMLPGQPEGQDHSLGDFEISENGAATALHELHKDEHENGEDTIGEGESLNEFEHMPDDAETQENGVYDVEEGGLLNLNGSEDMDEGVETQLMHDRLTKLHERADRDGDGRVSLAEATAFVENGEQKLADTMVQETLEAIGVKTAGSLTWPEYKAWMSEIHGSDTSAVELEWVKFNAADISGDGNCTGEELRYLFHTFLSPAMQRLENDHTMKQQDKDGDGKLNFNEFRSEGDEDMAKEDKISFAEHDTNGDGLIDIDELASRTSPSESAAHVFEFADKNKDGHMTLEELLHAGEQVSMDHDNTMAQLQNWFMYNEV